MKREEALVLAETLVERLRPGCERIEIAGSIRRGKAMVKDIEIVAIPKAGAPRPIFGQPIFLTQVDKVLFELRGRGFLAMAKNGDKYKKFFYGGTDMGGIDVDLFLVTPPAQWGVLIVIRTGPADFSQWIVTQRAKGGALPDGWCVRDGGVYAINERPSPWGRPQGSPLQAKGGVLVMPEERDYLDFLGLGWVEPGERKAAWRR